MAGLDLLPQNTGLLSMLQGVLGSKTTTGQDTKQNTAGTSNITGGQTTSQKTTTESDTTDLKTVLSKQLGGVTPDQIAAIYQQGAKQVPGLTNTFADAMGMQARNNTALGNSTSDLNSSILAHIADLNVGMTNAAGSTAANISNANKTQTTTGNTASTQSGTTTGNTTGNTTGTSNTAVDTSKLLPLLLGAAGVSGINSLFGDGKGGTSLTNLATTAGTWNAGLGKAAGAVGLGDGTGAAGQLGQYLGLTGAGSTAATSSAVSAGGSVVGTALPALAAEGAAGAVGAAEGAALGASAAEGAAAAAGSYAATAEGATAVAAAVEAGVPAATATAAMTPEIASLMTNPYTFWVGAAMLIAASPLGPKIDDGLHKVGNKVGDVFDGIFGGLFDNGGGPVVPMTPAEAEAARLERIANDQIRIGAGGD